jgi:hypothetical protein
VAHSKTTTFLLGLFAIGCLSAQLAHADPLQVSMVIPNQAWSQFNNVYVNPYKATITPTVPGGPSYDAMIVCDDLVLHTPIGQSNTYDLYSKAYLDSNSLWTKPPLHWSGQEQYYEAAYLSNLLITGSYANATERGLLSYAIWGIFDPVSAFQTGSYALSAADAKLAQGYIDQAALAIKTGSSVPDFAVLVPRGSSQEFLLIRTPEASAVAVLIFNLTGLLGLVLVFRRHMVRG